MRTASLLLTLLLAPTALAADLSGTKAHLLGRLDALSASTARLAQASDAYYTLAKGANFDYARLWKSNPAGVKAAVERTRAAWRDASPRYEQIEGFFAGQDPFDRLDLIIDAANPGTDGGVDHDVKLPNGTVLRRPGALFNLTEAALWSLDPRYTALKVNLGAKDGLGNALPDANVLKGGVDALHGVVGQLRQTARGWQPSTGYVFSTLTANVPTTQDFLEVWRASRFVTGGASKTQEFAAISRLNDLRDNIGSWQVIYAGVSPEVRRRNVALDTQVRGGLTELRAYVERLIDRERQRRFTPEQALLVQREAQDRATAIAGPLTQAAALLGVKVAGQ
ncbi:Efem/EfeO family lipoprotein (plasmid) [Deinococcus aetherius]|uniref:Efem/EfeO family lipoprotein n=1 Tax=Deinococcus aetherius TaxID=200252 RepID=A0ABM8ALN4_9DEIO|nr:imelysin family protein [Deinococcus aetherius]BDP44659.1 Efem/EfeO family lipoprotein [Deinococcus aetherius]